MRGGGVHHNGNDDGMVVRANANVNRQETC